VRDGVLPPGLQALLGGLAFSLGLILVLVGGAELFTGNVLLVVGLAARTVSLGALGRNWTIVYLGNLVGAIGLVLLVYWSGIWQTGDGAIGKAALKIAAAKTSLPFEEVFVSGILCNILVCLAVWLGLSARTSTDRILGLIFPITAFVALGFEHSTANMFFLPFGFVLNPAPRACGGPHQSGPHQLELGHRGQPVACNPREHCWRVRRGGFVGLAYWFAYLRDRR